MNGGARDAACFELRDTGLNQGTTDAMALKSRSNSEVVEESAATVVAAEQGADDLIITRGDLAQCGVSLEKGDDVLGAIRQAQPEAGNFAPEF